jgi:serine/threonine protein kinase/Tol biopolymer transport system component
MRLSAGDKLGPYEITGLIGKGGMGEVYRGIDTRLGRPVAIKVSSREFNDRFEREAKAISALNHPNICTLYDIGPNYLVMEFVEGELLSKMIESGPLPLDKALGYAVQIVDALAAAHAKGVIHRDLKPGNIIITRNGVKVLDFGLAKLSSERLPSSSADNVETVTEPITRAGSVLGTLYYMAPEQVEAKETDERSDIFSFGVVFYEMITGQRPFTGDTQAATLASLMKDSPPPMNQRQPAVPRALERVVRKCLEKKPDDRWQSARDLKPTLELIDLDAPPPSSASASVPIPVQTPTPEPAQRKWLWPAIAAGALVVGVALALWAPWKKAAPTQAVRFEVGPSEKMTFVDQAAMAVSPDGRWMVFTARGEDGQARYYIRALDGVEVRALPGTEGPNTPAASWSYDSRWVVFANDASTLKKVDIQGGPPQNIAAFPGILEGADWNSDGVIIAGSLGGAGGQTILRVPAAGGQTTPLTVRAPGEGAHYWPQFLPDGKHFLYLRTSSDAAKAGVYVGSIDVKPNEQSMQRLLATNRQAFYAPAAGGTGHLIFMRGATLMAQPFDPGKMILSSEPVAIADGVDSFTTTSHGLFSVSNTGTLVYRGGSGPQTMLTWFDQQGNPVGTLGDPGDYTNAAISPDGSRVAATLGAGQARDIWILDVARGASTRFTFDPARDDFPAWSPDGKNIAFSSNRGGQLDLYIKPADGSGEEKLLLKTDDPKLEEHWTKDGRFLLFTSTGPKTAQDMWALPFPGETKPVSLLQTQFSERLARVSPDGRWLAYASNESGAYEIYVRPFTPEAPAGTGAKWLVSKGGGYRPIWRPDGKALFYLYQANQAMAVDIDTSKGFQAGTPKRMFTPPSTALTTGWDLSPDGKRFLIVAPPNTGRTIPFTVVLNWAAGLKK